jgi:hypothetical protein
MRITSTSPALGSQSAPYAVPMLPPDDPTLLADIKASQAVDISQCETVCLALGPYRNLTTLTAATLFLHPHCQVLNHAGMRVYASPSLDFFLDYSVEKFERFMRYAVYISAQGERGDYGGSIVHSHAFDQGHAMKELFESTGGTVVKPQIKSLFWKESLLTSNHIREKQVDFVQLFAREKRLRFLQPVRNPMDCAVSNLKSVHVKKFPGISENPDLRETTQAVLEEIYWVADLKERFPDRFFLYFEHSIDSELLKRLAAFLKLDASPEWMEKAMAAMEIKKGYAHDASLLAWYREHVGTRFARFPALREQLLRFLPN